MPAFVYNANTEKETTLKELHTDWNDLKKAHAVVIKQANINFNKNLGKILDNRVTLWKAVHTAKDTLDKTNTSQLAAYRAKLNALKSNAKAGVPIVAAYVTLVRKLNVATTKHAFVPLERQLVNIDKALKYDVSYADNM